MAKKNDVRKRTIAFPPTVSRTQLLVDGSDDTFRGFLEGFFAFAERVQAARAGLAEYIDLTRIQFSAFVTIAHLERHQDVSVNLLATRLHLSSAFITTVTNQLETFNLISKTKDKNDRRRLCLATTPKGRKLLERLAPVQRQVNDQLFAALTAKEFRDLASRMETLIDCGDQAVALLNYVKRTRAVGLSILKPARGSGAKSTPDRKRSLKPRYLQS